MGARPAGRRWLPILAALLIVAAVWILTADPHRDRLWRVYDPWIVIFNLALTYVCLAAAYLLAGGARRRQRGMRVAALTAALLFVIGLVEFPAVILKFDYGRWIGPPAPHLFAQLARKVNRPDPELLHLHWPHSTFSGESVGNLVSLGIPQPHHYPVELRYDHNGFRNEEDLERAEVVAIGDSFVEAALTPLEKTVVKQLEGRLGETVANLGQAGYGLKQELIVLERYGLPLKPRRVLWFFFGGNDLRDVRTYDRAREQVDQGVEARRPFHQRMLVVNAIQALAHLSTPVRRTADEFALQRSGLFALADGSVERVYCSQTNPPWKEHQWETATTVLDRADHLSRAAGAELLVVYVPRKFRVYREFLDVEEGSVISGWEVNRLPEELGRWCRDQGIAYIDLTPYLQDRLAAGQQVHLVDDVHWNDTGHAVAAQAIAGYLLGETDEPE